MKKGILLLTSIFTLLTIFSSCFVNKKSITSTNTKQVENALLWKIDKDNLSAPSYIYGTIHIMPKDDYFYPIGTMEAIKSCRAMVFEIDMNDMEDMGKMMKIMEKAKMKDDQKLSDLISEEDYIVVQKHFKKIGIPLIMFERMKPAFLSIFASEDMSPTAMQSGDMKSYEMEFLDISKEMKMEVGGLETIEFQLSIFDEIPYKTQAKQLVESIKSSDEGDDEFAKMVELYKHQNLKGMGEMFSDETLGDMDLLLNQRNKNWIPVIMKKMEEKPTFFAVGAGHLVGEKGVITLLRKQGYTLTPIIKS
jgi:uncharacterized protein YbaP (TraB family)